MVKQFIDGCTACQQMKVNTHPTAAPLMPIKSNAKRNFSQVTMDFITDLPLSDGFDSIFIVVDQGLTKGVILMPCNKTITAEQTAHNAKTQEAVKQSPFYLMYGSSPIALPLVSEKTDVPTADKRIDDLRRAREEALAAHDLARIKMMERTLRKTKPFKVNDKVWLSSRNLKIPYQSNKLAPKREGPFTIKEVLGPVTYRLTLPRQWKIHDVYHAALLTPFKETSFHGTTETKPPPDLVEGEQEYEVEAILAHRQFRGKYQYLVKWKGYDSSENTWEPENNLTHMKELLAEYKKRRRL